MITGLYETHIHVSDLGKAVTFYTAVLGLQLAYYDTHRPIAFLWMGEGKKAMLGLWENKGEFEKRHFAFTVTLDFMLNKAKQFLEENRLQPYNFLKNGTTEPMVFAWMPAVAIYFNDADGNQLEFITLLEGAGKPEVGVVTYEQWLEHN